MSRETNDQSTSWLYASSMSPFELHEEEEEDSLQDPRLRMEELSEFFSLGMPDTHDASRRCDDLSLRAEIRIPNSGTLSM